MLTRAAHLQLVEARDRLCEDLELSPSVSDVARQVGMSPGQLIRRFAAVFGETPHRYRTRLRLERARRMLVLDAGSVTDVCMAVGFTSVGSFSSLFSRRFGEAPSSYRGRVLVSAAPFEALSSRLMPGCLSLMEAAWAAAPQFSRSAADIRRR